MWNRFKTLDPWLYVVPVLLSAISVSYIYVLTVDSLGISLALRQGVFAVIGLFIMLAATFLDYRALKSWALWIFIAGMIGLVLVRLPFLGKSEFGAQLWIDFGFFQLQPAEVEKFVVIVAVAALLSRSKAVLTNRRFLLSALAVIVPTFTVLFQPDLGTAIVIGAAGVGMLLHGQLKKIHVWAIALSFVFVIASFVLSFKEVAPFDKMLKEYQKDRLASFVEPSRDPDDSGYNVVQSVIAVGSGGITGKGIGLGSQSQLNFLPVAHTDFIFAGISETWGLVGSWGVIGLYLLLMLRTMQAARIAKDDFGMLLCIGVTLKILVEVLVNIGMNIRVMPVTGIPLPFLSYGGTTMLVNALCIGAVQSVVIRYKRLTF